MKLATYRSLAPGATGDRLGVLASDGRMADLRLAYAGYLSSKGEGRPHAMADTRFPQDMTEFLKGGTPAMDAARSALEFTEEAIAKGREPEGPDGELIALDANLVKLRAPIPRPGKFLHTGINFYSHLEETGHKKPDNVQAAGRFSSTLIGHEEPVVHPHQTEELEWEPEVCYVIGENCKDVKPENALDVIVGYTVYNDVSARDIQRTKALGSVFLAKNLDTTNPLGPYLVTADEVPNPESLRLTCRVNGQVKQDSDLAEMVFGVRELVAFFSQMSLEPGDIISSGTCGSVDRRKGPRIFLKNGDVMECEVEHVGVLRNSVVVTG
ncbi:MAG: fumarylacetoacetate hydrolase family protein [Nitrospinaceae bacterium]|jgi:acylpyruvate hydrolase|nr:fumarylacetoacetate hydrolase family protein [Nitrospinaceae bacterium]